MQSELTSSYSQRNLAAFQDALKSLRNVFADQSISEIMINGPDDVFISQRGQMIRLDVQLPARDIGVAITILAAMSGKVVDKTFLILSAALPGMRIEAVMPPVALKGPTMCIRRHATRIMSLDDYVGSKVMSNAQAELIRKMVSDRDNFLIAGGTGSGKTTLMNCVLALIDPKQRLYTIEQVQELKISAPNHTPFECDPEQGVTAKRLVESAMRFKPDRVILGELRGGEAFDWLNASNTGHPGSCATIHADSASDALTRLESLLLQADTGMPYEAIRDRIGSTLKTVLFIKETSGERRLEQICLVKGYDRSKGEYRIETFNYGE